MTPAQNHDANPKPRYMDLRCLAKRTGISLPRAYRKHKHQFVTVDGALCVEWGDFHVHKRVRRACRRTT